MHHGTGQSARRCATAYGPGALPSARTFPVDPRWLPRPPDAVPLPPGEYADALRPDVWAPAPTQTRRRQEPPLRSASWFRPPANNSRATYPSLPLRRASVDPGPSDIVGPLLALPAHTPGPEALVASADSPR